MLKNHIEIEYLVDSYKKTLSGKNANTRGSSFHSSRLRIVIFPLRVFFTVLLKDYFSVIFYLFHLGRKKRLVVKKAKWERHCNDIYERTYLGKF